MTFTHANTVQILQNQTSADHMGNHLTILKHFHCALYIWIRIKSSFSFLPDSFHYLRPEIAWTGRSTQLSQSPAFSKPELGFSTDRDSKFFDLAIKMKLLCHRMAQPHTHTHTQPADQKGFFCLKHSLELFFKKPSNRIIHNPRKQNKTSWIKMK